MILILSLFLVIIFIILSAFHFYWVFGGTYGLKVALPTNKAGVLLMKPKPRDSASVGIGLLAIAIFYFILSGIVMIALPSWIMNFSLWFIPIVFLLRSIGEFKHVGFFKKVKSTQFARRDSLFFSPLCLLISAIGFFLTFLV